MTRTLQVAPSNAEQARAWDGDEGAYWAEHADQFDLALRGYRTRFLRAAAIGPADHVLDIGCGTGEITREAARRAAAGRVLGVDLSAAMLRVARRRAAAEGLANAEFEQVDAQVHPFAAGEFDLAVSRTGTMFFADLGAAFRNIAHAVRPGGRLVQLVWQPPPRNDWFLALTAAMAAGRDLPAPPPGAPGPFSLSDPDRVRRLLAGTGFAEPDLEPLTAPMHFGADADDAHRFVTGLLGWMLTDLDDSRREQSLADLRATLRAHETPDGVLYPSATWLITATRA
ncbi:methyltransferase domain-containing protein [Streptomyces sp. HUCO-GS316]|uniref:class I SAM-dependent methyltransferase n=1 Tax=Streptomyces sp. HUCO-GS316 TaxID=2692198 RepID=UPI00136EA17A|nr:class I SAM-dependent methyltransferase [Streptomyces sp. HUCO-GS316]MXM66456.1 methyltransferase domain-containing protein [Streptomyces sp. HUCO-GS316]